MFNIRSLVITKRADVFLGGDFLEEIKVVYAFIQNSEGQVLMVENHEGHWSFPGGRVEKGETLAEAAVREAYEETNLIIKIGNIMAIDEVKFSERNHHAIFFTFEGKIISGNEEIKMPEEIFYIEWVDMDQVERRAPYLNGIHKVLSGNAPYFNQGIR